MVYDSVTRATRVAKLLPGLTIRVEVMRTLSRPVSRLPTIGEAPMTDSPLKQEVLRVPSELVEHCPEVRFGQLIVNLSCIARGPTPEAVWDMEDDELLAAAKSHLEDYERRHANAETGSPSTSSETAKQAAASSPKD